LVKSLISLIYVTIILYIVIYLNKKWNNIPFNKSMLTFKKFINFNLIGILCYSVILLLIIPFFILQQIEFRVCSFDSSGVLSLIITTYCIAVYEEFFFRGLISQTIFLSTQKLFVTSIISSLLFLSLHLFNIVNEYLIWSVLLLLIGGILLTYLFFFFKSIWVPIGFHFSYNVFGYALDHEMLFSPNQSGDALIQRFALLQIVGLSVLTIVIISKYHRINAVRVYNIFKKH